MTRCLVLIAAIAILATGCAFGHMETARQLEHEEIVVSGSLEWPGAVFIPRLGVNGMYGIGGVGDLSAHAGTTIITVNGGFGARAYLGDRFTASLQADGIYNFDPVSSEFFTGGDELGVVVINVTPRLTTAVRDDELFYAGLKAHYLGVFHRSAGGDLSYDHGRSPVGALFGIDHDLTNSPLGIQAEISVSPVAVDFEEGLAFFDSPPYAFVQLGIAVYHRW